LGLKVKGEIAYFFIFFIGSKTAGVAELYNAEIHRAAEGRPVG
jgi:hypothetical protein